MSECVCGRVANVDRNGITTCGRDRCHVVRKFVHSKADRRTGMISMVHVRRAQRVTRKLRAWMDWPVP